jgi:hypothetical protein
MKTWFLIGCMVCSSIVVVGGRPQAGVKGGSAGWVRGTIADEDGGLEGIPLVIEGAGASYEVVTGINGKYQTSVPPGTYKIYPQFSPGDPGYLRFMRAKFQVLPGAYTTIDLSPFAGFDHCSRNGERVVDLRPAISGKVRKLPAPNYDTYLVPRASGEPLDLVIDFCKREMKGGLIVYKSVTATFNDTTLYADTISLRPKDLLLQNVEGKATLISGGENRSVTQLTSFFGRRAFIDLTEGFTDSIKVKTDLHAKNVTFDLDIERGGPVKVVYEDKERNIRLVSEGESLSSVTIESPHRIKLSGYGVVTDNKLPYAGRDGCYLNFNITIETYKTRQGQLPSTISIESPSIDGYKISGVIPEGSVKIRHEMPMR